MDAASTERICVAIRIRPLNEKEIASSQEKAFKSSGNNSICQCSNTGPSDETMYYYDKIFDEDASTTDVYSHVAKDIVQGVVQGINGTIFACNNFAINPIPNY